MGCTGSSTAKVPQAPPGARAAPGFEAFGSVLLTKDGPMSAAEVLADKTAVGVYFSAHWCPPCRGFTPELAEWYDSALKAKGMEIVFVSSDRKQKEFDEYFAQMPWVALPFGAGELKEKLSRQYKVQGIPSLVILGPGGEVINKDGRQAVSKDPQGENYPWVPPTPAEKAKSVLQSLGPELLARTSGKPFGLYFSAHWCPPCRGFTPQLAQSYRDGLKDKMEVIFVSSDQDQKAFDEYFAEMPWQALPYAKRKEKEALSNLCGVRGIPTFVVFNPDGTVISEDGRGKVMKDPRGENFPEAWMPQPFADISDGVGCLQESQCLIMCNGSDIANAAVKQVAQEHYVVAGRSVDDMQIRFFAAAPCDLTSRLEAIMQLSGPQLVLLDIPDGGGFYQCKDAEPTVEVVKAFLDAIRDGKVPRKQLKK